MPSGSWKAKCDVQCPFYKCDDAQRRKISCEGIVDDSTLALYFQRKQGYDTQLKVFCCERYKKCEVYKMLMEAKYEERE